MSSQARSFDCVMRRFRIVPHTGPGMMKPLRMMHADMPHSPSQAVIDDSSGACRRRWGRGRAGSPMAAGDRAGLSAAPLRVCYVFFCLLRSFTLRYAFFSRTVEGQEAQQRERGAADAGADGPAVIVVHGVAVPLASSASSAPPVSPGMRTDRRTAKATAGVRHEKWRSGRIVPSRTRLHHCENRGIMRKLLNPLGVLARTILPERQNGLRGRTGTAPRLRIGVGASVAVCGMMWGTAPRLRIDD